MQPLEIMKIIGIVGTAKNTGKTTTLAALIETSGRRGERIGVTGIGFDGEEIDTITGLPKPRLTVQPGTIVCTSEQCLRNTTAGYTVIETTTAETALGRIVIVEITSGGLMVLAGPNTKRMLGGLIGRMRALGIGRMFVDGSLNRIAAMGVVDTIIFTTGASRTTEIAFLAEEARAICRLFDAPRFDLREEPDAVTLLDRTGAVHSRLSMRSLYDREDAEQAASHMNEEIAAIVIPNLIALRALERFVGIIHEKAHPGVSVVLSDPTIMLLAGEPIQTQRCIEEAQQNGIAFRVLHPIRTAAMTVNPFYPRQHDHAFVPAYVDKMRLRDAVTDAVDIPVFNIRDEGAPESLYSLL
jgi:hypothetical protein